MNIGEKLLSLRKQKNLSQEEVASILNVSRQTVSKWETDQSTPDFDRIVPICELYEISADELLGNKNNPLRSETIINNASDNNSTNVATAKVISISVLLYFISVIWIVISEETLQLNEGIIVGVFLLICAFATIPLIYHFVSLPKKNKERLKVQEKIENKKITDISNILALLTTAIYLFISFITGAWYITWIIWIIYALILEIVKLVMKLKGDLNE